MRRLPPFRVIAVAVLITVAGMASSASPSPAGAITVEPVIWQLDQDYPGHVGGDAGLSVSTVYIKTHDGSDWMSTYDSNPRAVSGPASIRDLIDIYSTEGIEVAAWFVPYGSDYDAQVQMAVQVIDSGVTALYADLEPFAGFCYLQCHELAENLWYRVRQQRPNAHLGVIYDPRPWWWGQSATSKWLSVADSALPMCYWEDFDGQIPYDDPTGCVAQAHNDLATLAPGRAIEYVPMLQGNTTAARFERALDAAVVAGSTRVAVWRRGTTSTEVWDLIGRYSPPPGGRGEDTLANGCLVREATQQAIYLVQGGAAFSVPSNVVFDSMGLDWRRVQVVPAGFIPGLPSIPRDASLVKEHGDPSVWLVQGGARFHLTSLEVMAAFGFAWEQVMEIPAGGLAQVPLVPRDYTMFTEIGAAQEYLVVGGARLPVDAAIVAALEAAGLGASRHYVVPQGGLDQVPEISLARGDADCSGSVAVIDAIVVLQVASGVPARGVCTHLSGDVDCDGTPLPTDALLILRFVAGDPFAQPATCPPVGEPPPTPVPSYTPVPSETSSPIESPVATATPAATTEADPTQLSTPTATAEASQPPGDTAAPTAIPAPTAAPGG